MNVYSSSNDNVSKQDSTSKNNVPQTPTGSTGNGCSSKKRGTVNNFADDGSNCDTIFPSSPWSCPDSVSEFSELKRVRTEKNQIVGLRLCPTTLRKLIMEVDDVAKLECWSQCTHFFFSCLGFDLDEQFQIGWLPQAYWAHHNDVLNDARTYMPLIRKIKEAHPALQIIYSLPPTKTFGISVQDIFKNNRIGFWHSLLKSIEGADGVELNLELCDKLPLDFWKSYEEYAPNLPQVFIVIPNSNSYLRTLPFTVAQIADACPDLYICLNSFGFKNGLGSSCQDLENALSLLYNRGISPEDVVVGIDSCGMKVVTEKGVQQSMEMISNREIYNIRRISEFETGNEGFQSAVDKVQGYSWLYESKNGRSTCIHYDSIEIQDMKLGILKECQGVICGDYYHDAPLLYRASKSLK